MDSGTIQEYYKSGEQYFSQMNFISTWIECTNFNQGKQWPPKTEKTKNLPRPVINITNYINNHKISQILSESVKMIFTPEEVDVDETTLNKADVLTQFSEKEWEEVKQDSLNEEALNKAAELGSGIYHYYFDNNIVKGKKNIVKGNMRGEILHPSNVMVGNPQCLDTQLQPYILILIRDDVDNIKSRAKASGIKADEVNKITGDKDYNQASNSSKYEVKDKATEIVCYWKENGYVHLMKVCGSVVTMTPINTNHKLYPIANINWYKIDNWYGMGETEGLIPNQKAINFMTAMQMMSEQLTGMPKLMLKEDYIKSFNNDPATPIMDNNPSGWSAQYLQPAYQSSKGQQLVEFILTTSKTHSGATETATGELAKSSQMNATAIMMLQKASAVPIDNIKKRFRRTLEEIGCIWLEFWTVNYNTNRKIKIKDDDSNEYITNFRGIEFSEIDLKLKIDIGASTDYSESIMMASLDKFLESDRITFKQYLENAPQTVIPFKEKLLKELESQELESENQLQSSMGQTESNLGDEEIAQLIKNLPSDIQQQLNELPNDQLEMVISELIRSGSMDKV